MKDAGLLDVNPLPTRTDQHCDYNGLGDGDMQEHPAPRPNSYSDVVPSLCKTSTTLTDANSGGANSQTTGNGI